MAAVLQSVFDHFSGPVVGHAGPVVRFGEDISDLLVGKIREYPPHEYLPVRFRQVMKDGLNAPGLLADGQQLLRRCAAVRLFRQLIQWCCSLLLAQRGDVAVSGDLAQPHPNVALAAEFSNAVQGLEKGLAGDLLRHVLAAGKAADIAVYILKIQVIDLFKFHSLPPPFPYKT